MRLVKWSGFQHAQAGHAYWMASMHEYVCSYSILDYITNYSLSFLRAAYNASLT